MPLKSGPPGECISEAPCGVAIGSSETRITDRHVAHHQLYIMGLVGTRGPQAPAIFCRCLLPTDAIF